MDFQVTVPSLTCDSTEYEVSGSIDNDVITVDFIDEITHYHVEETCETGATYTIIHELRFDGWLSEYICELDRVVHN